jgi:CheY-like chemotaxis protein
VDRERIFEPFVTTKPIGVGTGLGLFVCRNIVRDLGGEITVGDRPGGGALFRVVLPAVDSAGRAARGSSVQPEGIGIQGRVLIVDDDPAVARSLAACLELAGIEVEIAIGGRQALEHLLGGVHFDLTYCDLMMRGTTGMDVAEELSKKRPDLLQRIVFMTGGAFTARAAAFAGEHVDRIVEKPFDVVVDVQVRLGRHS